MIKRNNRSVPKASLPCRQVVPARELGTGLSSSAVGYARVSTRDQERLSVPTQIASCEAYAKDNGFRLDKVFSEARSGFKEGARKEFYDLLEYIRKEKPAALIYLLSDQLARNLEDFTLLVKFCKDARHNLLLHDIYKKRIFGILDPTAFEDYATTQKEIIDNRLYSERLRLRVEHSIRDKLARGEFPGYAPVGYRNEIDRGRILVDPERLPLIVQAFNIFATGDYSLDDITKLMKDKGLTVRTPRFADRDAIPCRPIGRAEMYRVLRSRFYIGEFTWSGKLVSNRRPDGTLSYEVRVAKETFDKVQAVFKRNLKRRMIRKGRPFLYRGLLECRHCGCQLVGMAQGKNGKYIYYSCSSGKAFSDPNYYQRTFGTKKCPQRHWKESEITTGLLKSMSLIEQNDAVFQNLSKTIGQEIVERHVTAGGELTRLRKRCTELQNKIDQILLAMTKNFSSDEIQDLRRVRDRLKGEHAELEDQIHELEGQDDSFVEDGLATLKTAAEFVSLFKIKDLSSGTLENDINLPQKKLLLKAVIITIICGEPMPKRGEKYAPLAMTFDGLEPLYNEPFNDLWEIKMARELEKKEAAMDPQPGLAIMPVKGKWRGRRDLNSRPPA